MSKTGTKTTRRSEAKPKSRLAEAILESARDLESLGVISKRTLRGYEKRCLESTEASLSQDERKASPGRTRPTVRLFTREDVARIRAKTHASQGYFAMQLNVSPTTVQQWESGAKKPSALAAKLLDVVDKHGLEVLA